ncbi:HlyD family efflux transporter periplasmic adaptor subunit [uncultured Ruminococcus sp.]|uniref:HlyD family efflux transporter periplasmic adaptor subunit n=1 Tax=uncultured Ruminococcus sp. TaxID=165186 RepID=UPI002625F056|nr:HlyD family efflux transporter periplasmic adaptor subunit [uncultured Ruminococcus sp.]
MRFLKTESSFMVKMLRNTVLILFVVVFISVIYNMKNRESDTESALIAEATASAEFKGVFIRAEQPMKYSGSGVLVYNVSDGGKLGKGSVIAEAYPDGSQITVRREEAAVEKQLDLLKKIQNPGTRESAQPAELSESIEEIYRNLMLCRDKQDYKEISNLKDELVVNMSTYQIITGEVKDFSQQIIDLQHELNKLKLQEKTSSEVVTSPRSCYFVSYCDGYEETLNKSALDSLTADQLLEITDERSDDPKVVGKLIDGYNWYLAGVVDNSHQEYKVGDYVRIRPESSQDIFSAEVLDIRDDGNQKKSVLILACREFSSELVQHRTENIELVRGTYRGLKVPREAIRFVTAEETTGEGENATTTEVTYKGVYVLKGEQVQFKKIDVIYEGSNYVLSSLDHTGDDSYLVLYDDIMIEGVDD